MSNEQNADLYWKFLQQRDVAGGFPVTARHIMKPNQ